MEKKIEIPSETFDIYLRYEVFSSVWMKFVPFEWLRRLFVCTYYTAKVSRKLKRYIDTELEISGRIQAHLKQ